MKTSYIIQMRLPNIDKEWAHWHWHDRPESRPHETKGGALAELRPLERLAETTQYRLVQRTEKVVKQSTQ